MVVVDTSVWLLALSQQPESFKVRIQLEELLRNYLVSIPDSVRYDLLQKVNIDHRSDLLGYINYLPLQQAKPSTWNIAMQVSWDLSKNGFELTQSEAITVAISLQTQSPLFTFSVAQREVANIRKLKLLS